MSTAKRTALATLLAFAGPLVIPLATSGMGAAVAVVKMSTQLEGKESATDHERDLREVQRGFQDSLYVLTRRMELRQVHDSAFNAMILERVTEGNCARNPRLAQCSPP